MISDIQALYDTILASPGNDFMCVNITNDTINGVWGDTRNGRLNIYFRRMSLAGIISSTQQLSSEKVPFLNISPNPAGDFINVGAKGVLYKVLISVSEGNSKESLANYRFFKY